MPLEFPYDGQWMCRWESGMAAPMRVVDHRWSLGGHDYALEVSYSEGAASVTFVWGDGTVQTLVGEETTDVGDLRILRWTTTNPSYPIIRWEMDLSQD